MRMALMFKNAVAVLASLSLMVPPSLAQQIVGDGVSTAPQVMTTANGLPMVMITAPNSAGVSHNTYTSFNIGTSGAILNNVAANTGLTLQAGLVQGNANLVGGTASLIINEVTANNPSALNGYLEVAGARADVVVANPYGITCSGCGFINTDRATLTTGAPVFTGGAFSGFSVNGGTIAIGELGADARGVGTFDLISQRVTFAGAVHGERVRVLAGRNDVIYATGAAAAKAPNGTEPELAVDSTVLGGMYANAITVQSTDQGVGVKAPATMAANSGEMRLTADGKLVIGRAASSGQLTAQARDIEVETSVNGQQGASLAALRDLTLKADAMIVSQAAIALSAGRDIALGAGSKVQSAAAVNLNSTAATSLGQQASVLAQGNVAVTAGSFDAAKQTTIIAGLKDASGASQAATLNLDISAAAKLAQSSLMSSAGMTFDAGSITVDADPLLPASRFVALGAMAVSADTISFGHAALHAEGALDLTAKQGLSFAQNADVFSRGNLTLGATDIDILGGEFLSAGQIAMGSQSLDIAAAGRVQSAQSLTLTGATASVAGDLSGNTVTATMSGDSSFSGDIFGQTSVDITAANLALSGSVKSLGNVTVLADAITQSGAVQAGDLIDFETRTGNMALSGSLLAANFALTAAGDVQSSALILDNRALSIAQSAATLPAAGTFTVTARNFTNLAAGVVRLGAAATFDLATQFSNAGDVVALADLTLTANTGLQNSGRLLAVNALTLTAAQMDNQAAGKIEAKTLTLTAPSVTNAGEILATDKATVLASTALTNTGRLKATNALGITTQSLVNSGNLENVAAALTITADSFQNASGNVKSGFGVTIATASAMTFGPFSGGAILSDDFIQLGGLNGAAMGALTLASIGQLVAKGDLTLHVAQLNNQGTLAAGTGKMTLRSTGDVTNSGLIYAGKAMAIASGGAVANNAGTLMAATDLAICGYDLAACLANPATSKAASLRNMNGGQIETLNGKLTLSAGTISNERDVVFVAGVPQTVISDEIELPGRFCGQRNFFGRCTGDSWQFYQTHTTTTADRININSPQSRIVSAQNLTLISNSLSNQYGLISARGNLSVDSATAINLGVIANQIVNSVDYYYWAFQNYGNPDRQIWPPTQGPVSNVATVLGNASGRIEAGGAITGTITGALDNVAGSTASFQAWQGGAPTLPDSGANTTAANPSDTTPANPASLTAAVTQTPQVVTLPSGGTISSGTIDLANLSNPQLFKINSDVLTHYLIETRHSFIDLAAFMSSDYFLGALNFAPDITQRRLGDAMVETMAVRDQLLQLTGGIILQPGLSERQQMQALYQNGIDAASALNLAPGVALNPTQIAALTSSMIWLEEQTIGGQRVLVPKVYLASSAGSATDGGGAVIRGSTIALNTGNVTNSGSILASNGLTLLASGNITNSFGSIAAGTDLTLLADNGTFSNLSGEISGRNVSISAGTVKIETTANTLDWQYGETTRIGPTARISATNTLSITGLAGVDIIGGALSGGTGLVLSSLGDIDIGSVARNDRFAVQNGTNAIERETTRFLAASLAAGAGDLTIGGGNIAITGANLSANGTLGLTATGKVDLLADTQTDYTYQFSQSSGFLHSSTNRSESYTATSLGANLNGGAIAITAGGDITTQAADLAARTGQIGVTSAAGNVTLLAAVDIHASYNHTSNSFLGGLFSNSSTTERLNTTIAANDLNAKTNIALDAAQNLTLTGGTLQAGGDVALAATNRLTLAGAVSTDYTGLISNNNSGFFIVDKTDVALRQTADFTKITAGDVALTGAEVVARLDQRSAAFGLNAKSLIGIAAPDSAQRLAASGQGPAPAAGGGSDGGDPAYDFAASRVNIGLPTALDDAGYAYLDDLKASGQLTVEEMKLVQHQFYDQDIQLGPLGQLLLQYVTAGMTSGLTGLQAAMAQAAISGGLEGALTGNFDVAAILRDVVFAGVSGAATAGFDLNDKLHLSNSSLLGAVDGQFSLASIANSLGDSVITAGLTTAVYGGTFGDNFLSSFSNSVVNLAQADLQTLIGDRYNGANALLNGGEGSAGHVFEHALLGCLAGSALGVSCEASAAAAEVSAIYAGAVDPDRATNNAALFTANATLLGGLGAALASGGDTNATMIASGVAGSAFQNNYLTHAQLEAFAAEIQACASTDEACQKQVALKYQTISDLQNDALALAVQTGDLATIRAALANTEGMADLRAEILGNWTSSGFAEDLFDNTYQAGTLLEYQGRLTSFDSLAMFGVANAVAEGHLDPLDAIRIAVGAYGPNITNNQADALLELLPGFALMRMGDRMMLQSTSGVIYNSIDEVPPSAFDPVAFAKAQQGNAKYPGVDEYRAVTLQPGDRIYQLGDKETGSIGNFFDFNGEAVLTAPSGRAAAADLQVAIHPTLGPYSGYSEFSVTKPIPAAVGETVSNPQYGAGGGTQVVIDIEQFGGCLSFVCATKFPKGAGE
jgi:filamentous hemagglutinin